MGALEDYGGFLVGVCVLIKRHIFRRRFMAAISMGVPVPRPEFLAVIAFHVNLELLLLHLPSYSCKCNVAAVGPFHGFPTLFPELAHTFSMVFGVGHKQLPLATEMTPIGNAKRRRKRKRERLKMWSCHRNSNYVRIKALSFSWLCSPNRISTVWFKFCAIALFLIGYKTA